MLWALLLGNISQSAECRLVAYAILEMNEKLIFAAIMPILLILQGTSSGLTVFIMVLVSYVKNFLIKVNSIKK